MSKAMIACADVRAGEVGLEVLRGGGNAVDAAIAVAVMLNVVDFSSTGVGGDMFALLWMASEGKVRAINGSGRSPALASLEYYRRQGLSEVPPRGPLAVTVPGALRGWQDLLDRYGTMPMSALLQPAIDAAENGATVRARMAWALGIAEPELRKYPAAADIFLSGGQTPKGGDMLYQKDLAKTLRTIADEGTEAFYRGCIADAIEASFCANGGLLRKRDLEAHRSDWVEPISTTYRGYDIIEFPPNSQGIALLEQLNILEGWDLSDLSPARHICRQIEAKRVAFADRNAHVTDPEFYQAPIAMMLDKTYAARRRSTINLERVGENVVPGEWISRDTDTTVFAVVDQAGNCVSFINSLFADMGSCVVAEGTGIVFQGRAAGFSLDPAHPNRLEPHKRTMHTLNPVMVLKDDHPYLVMGAIGGDQQTPAIAQVLTNHIDFGMTLETAVVAPRWANVFGLDVHLEPGFADGTAEALAAKGYRLMGTEAFFGGVQAIRIDLETGALSGASDPRVGGAPVAV